MFWKLKLEAGLPEGVEVGVLDPDEGKSRLEMDENLIGLRGGIFCTLGDWGFSVGQWRGKFGALWDAIR